MAKKRLLKHRTSRRTLEVSRDGEKRRVPSKETNLNELGNTLSKTCTKKALKKRKKKKELPYQRKAMIQVLLETRYL